jgi:hypothetical protein
MTEETKAEEKKEEVKVEEKPKEEQKTEERKEGFNFKKWLRGSNKREFIENISFLIIVISAIMVSAGIGLGSFVQQTVFLAIIGAFFVMVGIAVYIISQFIGE